MEESKKKMPKVGILTFHRAINFGALLQAYALQRVIQSKGCDCQVIDYQSYCIDSRYLDPSLKKCRTVRALVQHALYSKGKTAKKKNFRQFAAENLSMSEPCRDKKDLERLSETYDIFISGSDQVWNYKITDFDSAYFLNFVSETRKKNAFAASFGISDIPREHIDFYRGQLQSYRRLSVREHRGKEIIKKLIGREAEVVMDPTLLLSKEAWLESASGEVPEETYILIYSFGLPQTLRTFTENLAKKMGMKIVYVPVSNFSLRNRLNAEYKTNIGPAEYLALFRNAHFVVTNSFHGTVFSLIFEKPFFVEKKKSAPDNSRFDNILGIFGLKNREIQDGQNNRIEEPVDYGRVQEILKQERAKSLGFLDKILFD